VRGHESNHLHLFQLLTFQKPEYGKTTGNTTAGQYPNNVAVEIQLNEEFGVFVSNYRLAYQGPNTAHAQIGSKLDGEGMFTKNLMLDVGCANKCAMGLSNLPICLCVSQSSAVTANQATSGVIFPFHEVRKSTAFLYLINGKSFSTLQNLAFYRG